MDDTEIRDEFKLLHENVNTLSEGGLQIIELVDQLEARIRQLEEA